MDWLIISGVIVTCIGLGLLIYTIARIWRAKKQDVSEDEMKAQLQAAIAWNLAAMGCSAIGLMIVVLGVLL
jgi:fructose-specific phosphotransferase system IIC component